MRKTKIICTLGPSTDDPKVLKELMLNGMNVARLNFSHGTHEEQLARANAVKKLRDELDLPIALLLDTKGPEIRVKTFKNGQVELKAGDTFTFYSEDVEGDENGVTVTYPDLASDLSIGMSILINDGLVETKVISIEGKDIVCRVMNDGIISDRKSINIPGSTLHFPYISEKDREDILFAIEHKFDFVAASFVRSAYDVFELKKLLDENGGSSIKIISKIENLEGVEKIDEILKISDGIMVARGDMGVEIAYELLPSIQKTLIEKCYKAGKIVITATQMLESMTHNPRPTRAESSDVANAVYDGTSAVMLSGETAAGSHPVESLCAMAKIVECAEKEIDYKDRFDRAKLDLNAGVTNAISHSTCTTAHDLEATAIITVSWSGYTARMISSFRPACPIIAAVLSQRVRRQLNLSWGIMPIISDEKTTTDDLFEHAVDRALDTGLVHNGDLVVITGGSPVGISGTTNILKVHLVGNVLVSGTGITDKYVSGKICVAKDYNEAQHSFSDGDILVMPQTSNMLISILRRASGIIVEEGGLSCHAAIVGMTLDIPVIVGAKNVMQILKSGTVVTIDAKRGEVYSGVTKVL